ncbi:serine threonine protein kinase [Malassezia pachydermatis]|uniref:Serine threonine protein kinase n=1 Tax=Malassezia pachydermatis TaxID=77020 RepID=A0A0M8MPE5_9BASI|nr:serine threonine protein kinase [Malassezia pachydermatis]KOS16576.1 serine threonine protein kinase [Malassezia pachydermatis]
MYRTPGPRPIRVWPFQDNTIAGDMGVTVIIQQIVTYVITSTLCNWDLRHGTKSLTRPWPPMMHFPSTCRPEGSWLGVKMPADVAQRGRPLYMGNAEDKSRFVQFCLWFLRAMSTGSERNVIFARHITFRQRIERLLWSALQGLWWAVITFWWFWPISIAIVAPIFEHQDMRGGWAPPLIKLVYGGVLGLLTNPLIALFQVGAESQVRHFYPDHALWKEQQEQEELSLPTLPVQTATSATVKE